MTSQYSNGMMLVHNYLNTIHETKYYSMKTKEDLNNDKFHSFYFGTIHLVKRKLLVLFYYYWENKVFEKFTVQL